MNPILILRAATGTKSGPSRSEEKHCSAGEHWGIEGCEHARSFSLVPTPVRRKQEEPHHDWHGLLVNRGRCRLSARPMCAQASLKRREDFHVLASLRRRIEASARSICHHH
ncbi:MAG: hypothetical protein WCB02_03355 [Bradyrhizobium sp.]